ncbi:unnamed protein product [Chrysoparadoxa australica]
MRCFVLATLLGLLGPNPSSALVTSSTWLGGTAKMPLVTPLSVPKSLGRPASSMSMSSEKAPWLKQGITRLIRGKPDKSQTAGQGQGGLPSLGALLEAVQEGTVSDMMTKSLPPHPGLKTGTLPNGLRYIILPNASPPERFEAHLEVFAGSADELDKQQGMAHLVEHIAYMGSRKRERLFGTGSQTNAYTDFHHTVFYASCPVQTPPGWGRRSPMLPRALDALCDVLEAKCEPSRLEKERAAVLSEMSMVNTIDYRVECQILSALHTENVLSRRFPIGKEHLIKSWTVDDIKEFHGSHYHPGNAMLYVIGDVDPDQVQDQIKKVFGHLPPRPNTGKVLTLKEQSQHFPPVTHKWSGGHITEANTLPIMDPHDSKPISAPRLFKHSLLQAFSLHIFAKRPIEPISSLRDLRVAIMKRIALASLQIRLSVNSRGDPPFTSIEFNQLDSPREACAVCYLDMTAEPARWNEAVKLAVREVRRLGMFGLTQGELDRFSSALLTDTQQLAAQGDRISNSDQLTILMESVASGHTFMDAKQQYEATRLVIESLTLAEVNEVAAQVCEHITLYGVPGAPQPSALVACVPESVDVSEDLLLNAVEEGVCEEISESAEVKVPPTFFSKELMQQMLEETKPSFVPFVDKEGAKKQAQPLESIIDQATGVEQLRLSNDINVNIKTSSHERQRGQLRIVVPGGRQLEKVFGTGSVAVGARTLQEGGAFGNWQREQVELFCIDHLVMVAVEATEEFLFIDFSFPTVKLHSQGSDDSGEVSGMEAAFQVVNQVLTDFLWEEDALKRAQQSFAQTHEATTKSLEGASTELLMKKVSGDDKRFMSVHLDDMLALTLDQVKSAIQSQLTTDCMEVTLVGDFDRSEAETFVLNYLGTIPASSRSPETEPTPEDLPLPTEAEGSRGVVLNLPDSDPRAVSYVSGDTPSKWGVRRGGSTLLDMYSQLDPKADAATIARRTHPLFPAVANDLIKEVINRRLFSTVREQKRLTYDAHFHLTSFERLQGSWYLITVTANPENAEAAKEACMECLADVCGSLPITHDNAESAKRVLINRHETSLRTNQYWSELLSGIQVDSVPCKDISCVRDYLRVTEAITAKDLQLLLQAMTMDPEKMFTCVGISVPAAVSASKAPAE